MGQQREERIMALVDRVNRAMDSAREERKKQLEQRRIEDAERMIRLRVLLRGEKFTRLRKILGI